MQVWRGEHYTCSHSEYLQVKRQLMSENHAAAPVKAGEDGGDGEGSSAGRRWQELSSEEQNKLLKERLKKYCQKVGARGGGGGGRAGAVSCGALVASDQPATKI